MTSPPKENAFDLERALTNPGDMFDDPAAVLVHDALDGDQKRAILERWLYDARELAVAEEEGMGGGESPLIERILAALGHLGGGDLSVSGAHKH